jgi:PhnB protein
MSVAPIPEGYRSITPHLTVKDCEKTIEFYKQAFGATLRNLSKDPQGRVMHADIQIGDSMVMLHDEYPEWGALSPAARGGSSVAINIHTADARKFWDQAVGAGAKIRMPLGDQFWGDRYGQLEDPSGHVWSVSQRIANPTKEEMAVALEKAFSGGSH